MSLTSNSRGRPQVIYRGDQGGAESAETFAREITGSLVCRVQLAVRPAANGAGLTFANLLPEAGALPEMVEACMSVLDASLVLCGGYR